MKAVLLIFISLFMMSCSSDNIRTFQFTYEVDIDSTNGKKLEVWLPLPKSNEVQNISELKINTKSVHRQNYIFSIFLQDPKHSHVWASKCYNFAHGGNFITLIRV